MTAPRELSADQVPVVGAVYPFLIVSKEVFTRPLYLRVLAVLLVLLVVAAAAYTIFIQPVDQLVINVGALLLGIWGVRNVLVGQAGPPITAVDLSISLVMLFLLAAVAMRTLTYLYARSGLPIPPPFRAQRLHVATDQRAEPDGCTTETLPEVTDLHRSDGGRP
jgi:hypothetical protein